MSIRVMSEVWAKSQHKGSVRLVLLALADFADDEGRNIYPGIAALAKKSVLDERTVQRILRRIEKSGEISIETSGHQVVPGVFTNEIIIHLDRLGVVVKRGDKLPPLSATSGDADENDATGRGDNLPRVTPVSPNPSSNNDTETCNGAVASLKAEEAEIRALAETMCIRQGHAALLGYGYNVELVERITYLFSRREGFLGAVLSGPANKDEKSVRLNMADQLLSRIGVENLAKSMKRMRIIQHLADNNAIIEIIGAEWKRIGWDKSHIGLMINRLMEAPQTNSEVSAGVAAWREIKAGRKLIQEALV